MKVLQHVDLGKAFEAFKNDIIEIEKEKQEKNKTAKDGNEMGNNYACAYGRLFAASYCHVAANTDINYNFVNDALKEAENPLETTDNTGAMAE